MYIYTVYISIITALVLVLTTVPTYVFASVNDQREDLTEEERESGFYNENGYVIQSNRPAINPDFDPDEDCDFDAFQLKCIPGSQQDCHDEGFANNEDYTCHLLRDCPDGYYSREDDETGQCYPDSEGCEWDGYVMIEREDGEGNTCRALYSICGNNEHKEEEYCIEYCQEYPDSLPCKPDQEMDN